MVSFRVKYAQLKRFNEDFKDHVYASFSLGLVCKKTMLEVLAFFQRRRDGLTCEMRGDLRVRNEMFGLLVVALGPPQIEEW